MTEDKITDENAYQEALRQYRLAIDAARDGKDFPCGVNQVFRGAWARARAETMPMPQLAFDNCA